MLVRRTGMTVVAGAMAAAMVVAAPSAPGPTSAATGAPRYRVTATAHPTTVLFGHGVTVSGRVRPRASGTTVKLQVFSDGGWHTTAVATLDGRSRFTATYTPSTTGTYQLRVRKPAGDGHRRGTSADVTCTVTPSLPPT